MNQAGDLQKTHNLVQNLNKILQHNNFCTFCLGISEDLLYLNECLVKGDWEGEELHVKDILDVVFGNGIDDFLSNFICKHCLSSAIGSYTFITRSCRTVKVYSEYLSQLDNRVTDLDLVLNDDEFKNILIILDNIGNDNILNPLRKNHNTYNEINIKSKETPKKEIPEKVKPKPTCICDLCGKEYIQKRSLKKHLSKHKSEVYEPIDCPCCRKRPCVHEKYLADVDKQMLERKEIITCLECNKQIRSTPHLIEHINKKHLDLTENGVISLPQTETKENETRRYMSYACLICKKNFKTIRERLMHFKKLHKKKPNFCMFCNKSCNSREGFLKHTQSQEHRNNAPHNISLHRCKLCDHAVRNRALLTAHVNRVHLKIRPYKCEYCSNSYFSSILLKTHLKLHTGEELKVCDICGLTFSGRRSLKKHKMRHTGENPYACPYCDDRTNCSSSLRLHIMYKHMVASIACPLCDSKFHTKRHVRQHIQRVHWKSNEKFDHTKLEGLSPTDYHFFVDRRKAV